MSYTIPELEPATTYYWKVVPYNAVGKNENASVWSFTTMEDQSVRDFPYTMDLKEITEKFLLWAGKTIMKAKVFRCGNLMR